MAALLTSKITILPLHAVYSGPKDIEGNSITERNAQNILPPTARVIVGNLPRNVDPGMVRSAFNNIGHNFVHIFMGGKYPVAFVQFLNDAHAQQALGKYNQIILNGRAIRVELSKDGQEEMDYQKQLQEEPRSIKSKAIEPVC